MKKDYIVELREEEADELMNDHWVGELVRCKDCKISKLEKVFKNVPTSTETVRWCELINRYVDDDWFCADGERKEA